MAEYPNNRRYNSQDRRTNRNRRSSYDPGAEQAIVETILKGLWFLLMLPFKRGKNGAKKGNIPIALAAQLASHWPSIQEHLQQEHTLVLAVSEADKLFDAALQAAGVLGTTMGERLKAAESRFPAYLYQQIWEAHKLRNTLAHEMGATISTERASQAVHTFRNALLQLGVLV